MKNISIKTIGIIIISILLFGCNKKNETTPTPTSSVMPALNGLTKLEEGYVIGASAKIEIWGKKNFFTGYNKLSVVLYDSLNSTELITNSQITFSPLMVMTMGSHTAPVENPGVQSVNNVFTGNIVFQMPTVTDGYWKLKVLVHNNKNGKDGEVEFDITVDEPTTAVLKMFTTLSPDSNKIILSLLKPEAPIVGVNDIEFTIHRKASMMSYPCDDSYTIEMDPQMPSMGHGSPNNINPTCVGNGHYQGKVNFIMTGWWRVNIIIKKGSDIVAQDVYFDITF